MLRILAAAIFVSILHTGFAAAAANEQQCKAAGGAWNAAKGTCTAARAAGTNTGGQPQPQEGIVITGCAPSASGDPLKGLNVDKGGKSGGGKLCPDQ